MLNVEVEEKINITLDLPSELIRNIDEMQRDFKKSGQRSKICRSLLTKAIERHIDLDSLDLKAPLSISISSNKNGKYPTRIGFVITKTMNNALNQLCAHYPLFSKKSLAEFLICQELDATHILSNIESSESGEG